MLERMEALPPLRPLILVFKYFLVRREGGTGGRREGGRKGLRQRSLRPLYRTGTEAVHASSFLLLPPSVPPFLPPSLPSGPAGVERDLYGWLWLLPAAAHAHCLPTARPEGGGGGEGGREGWREGGKEGTEKPTSVCVYIHSLHFPTLSLPPSFPSSPSSRPAARNVPST